MFLYKVRIVGKNVEAVKSLLQLIKGGYGIRPEISYDAPQGGLSRAELEHELKIAESESKCLADGLQAAELELATAKTELGLLENKLRVVQQDAEYKQKHPKGVCVRLGNIHAMLEVLHNELNNRFFPFVSVASMIKKLRTILQFAQSQVKDDEVQATEE